MRKSCEGLIFGFLGVLGFAALFHKERFGAGALLAMSVVALSIFLGSRTAVSRAPCLSADQIGAGAGRDQ